MPILSLKPAKTTAIRRVNRVKMSAEESFAIDTLKRSLHKGFDPALFANRERNMRSVKLVVDRCEKRNWVNGQTQQMAETRFDMDESEVLERERSSSPY